MSNISLQERIENLRLECLRIASSLNLDIHQRMTGNHVEFIKNEAEVFFKYITTHEQNPE